MPIVIVNALLVYYYYLNVEGKWKTGLFISERRYRRFFTTTDDVWTEKDLLWLVEINNGIWN